MRIRLLLIIALVFFANFYSKATHIVGGSLTYEQLGGSTYRITLKLYRDCRPGNAAFPNPVVIQIRRDNGTAHTVGSVSIPFPGASAVPPNIDTCAVNPGICLEEAVYTTIVTGLPPGFGGYHLYYQYCCRNSTLMNIVSPLTAGETWYAHIPENGTVISNSSPKWVKPPPVFVCQGNNMFVNHSATDADGDSLAYSLYTPYNNGAITYPGNVFTTAPVTWSSTYGANNPLNPSVPNSLTINSSGILQGVPPTIGQFVAGVRCEEWRNGIKIGEILRDFQFNVVNCPPVAVPDFTTLGTCSGTNINFQNTTSPPANTYFWNFGDGATLADTANIQNPSYNYPALGSYNVMLVINRGTPCADTVFHTVVVGNVQANFSNDAPACKDVPINFSDLSTFDPSSPITNWQWNFGDGFGTSTSQNPNYAYGSGGMFNVTLITTASNGCTDTAVYSVNIQGLPIANAGNDTISCTNNPTVGLGGTILNAGGGIWNGSGTFNPSTTTLNATYTPSASAVANGADTLLLITTSNALCPADTDQVIITFYAGPTANAGSDIYVCRDTISVPITAGITVASGGTWQTMGSGTFANANALNTLYYPSAADTTAGSVIVFLTTTGNGNCNASRDSVTIFFTPVPIVAITSGTSACASNPINLNVNSSTTAGFWTTNGTGTFAPSNSILNPVYYPSTADDAAGTVVLIFESTNNGGCRSVSDTLNLTLIPSPVAAYTSNNACPTFPITFTDGSTTSVGTITNWNWSFGDASPNSTSQNTTHTYPVGGPYNIMLIVTSSNGCVDTVIQTLNVYEKPNAAFNANGICQVDGTVFTDSSTVGGSTITSWLWNFGDAQTSTTQNPIHYYSPAGTYTVTLIVQSAQGCIDTVTQNIGVLPGPTANFTADDFTANINQTVNFSDQSVNPIAWFWDFGDSSMDSTSTLQNPSHVYSAGGYYDVCLYVTDMNGCTDTICKTEIVSSPPDVPSGFSPNGDGANDIFYVYGGPFKKLRFRIYNNWGELIFESTEQSKGWDGKRDGIDQPMSVYVYTVEATTEDDENHKLSGDVTLLR